MLLGRAYQGKRGSASISLAMIKTMIIAELHAPTAWADLSSEFIGA